MYAAENGAEAGFLGTVGEDVIGEHILKCAREKHVDISHCPVKHGVSGRAAVNIVDGDRVFVSGYFEEKHGVGSLYPPMLQCRSELCRIISACTQFLLCTCRKSD